MTSIIIGSDHGGYELKELIIKEFTDINFKDYGTFSTESVDYPDIAIPVAEDVASGKCEKGILICRSGVGMDIMANKVNGIRCVRAVNTDDAFKGKHHNGANVLAIGSNLGLELTNEIVDTFNEITHDTVPTTKAVVDLLNENNYTKK